MQRQVVVRCPQGIDRLIQLGRAVAREKSWRTHPRAREAWIGLWLDAAIATAGLHWVLEETATSIQGLVRDQPLPTDLGLIDDAARGWLEYCGALGMATDERPPPDALNIDVRLPTDTGNPAVGAGVVLAAVAIASASGAFAWTAPKFFEAWINRPREDMADDQIAADFVATLELGEKRMAEGKPLSEADKLAIQARKEARLVAVQNITKRQKPSSSLFDIDTSTLILAAAVLGGAYLFTRK